MSWSGGGRRRGEEEEEEEMEMEVGDGSRGQVVRERIDMGDRLDENAMNG